YYDIDQVVAQALDLRSDQRCSEATDGQEPGLRSGESRGVTSGGHPALIIFGDRRYRGLIKPTSRLGCRQSRVRTDASVGEFAAVVGRVGEVSARRDRRVGDG